MAKPLMASYRRLPVAFIRGQGCWLFDEQDRRYLDGISGVAVCGLGHAHPDLARAVAEQMQTLVHTSNLYRIPYQERLGQELCDLSGLEAVFFCNSGAEANEAAIKLARLYGHQRGVKVPTVVVMEGGFHGRTMATLSATANRAVQAGFEPLVQGFVRVPYNDLAALEQVAAHMPEVVAVMLEPIQGEGGINLPDPGFLQAVRALCDRQQWLMMLDEIQTGIGRTGRWFAFQHEGLRPDVVTLAKGLGNGVPIGACLAGPKASELIQPGSHGSTFGGNLLACRAGLTVLEVIRREGLLARAAELGAQLLEDFRSRLQHQAGVRSIRGRGCMVGIELDRPCGALVERALDRGVLINVTAGQVIRLLPPLVMAEDEARHLAEQVADLTTAFLNGT